MRLRISRKKQKVSLWVQRIWIFKGMVNNYFVGIEIEIKVVVILVDINGDRDMIDYLKSRVQSQIEGGWLCCGGYMLLLQWFLKKKKKNRCLEGRFKV